MFELAEGGVCRGGTRDQDQPITDTHAVLIQSHEFAQTPSDTVPHDRSADPFGGDESDLKSWFTLHLQGSENQCPRAVRRPFGPHPRKLPGTRQALGSWSRLHVG